MQPGKHRRIIAMGRISFILQDAQLILTLAPFKGNKEMHRSVTCKKNFKGIYIERLVLLNWRYQSILE